MSTQNYACVMRKGHPIQNKKLTKELFAKQEYLLVEDSGSGHFSLEKALLSAGMRSKIKVRLPQYLAAPYFIVSSDLIWCVPKALANKMVKCFPLIVKPIPISLPDFEVSLYWHDRYHKDPGNMWFRKFIINNYSE